MHLFYQPDPSIFELDEEEARHTAKVLRLSTRDLINVTDGRGLLQTCRISVAGKRVIYDVIDSTHIKPRNYRVCMAVAPTRKTERNEWMVEKMTEIGVDRIDFVVTEHTHTEGINRIVNLARLNRIAAAAMKQSQQFYLPEITLVNSFKTFVEQQHISQKFMAYVPVHDRTAHVFSKIEKGKDSLLLIGPEGDFTPAEVEMAMSHGFETVSLGNTRLRTETAAVAGCHAINLAQFV
ncbi:Ribosomal RNA small subunit methyltransferase E [Dyadobacter sp. CECT 9275]|uniref:Ribosomal RNA small subunit methyltransferase E n=1 Tax=Dyadobacter helix TaxID=2822344 RepID=A0A916JH27_9BACT|nr:RsmE family RNA methyltransferase [Dyadobacter sp. CECT 9275]CAG5016391.1 Ribosomal RNA small subunit methyltransferase E [Dyadobacter sp. CECT 9275]